MNFINIFWGFLALLFGILQALCLLPVADVILGLSFTNNLLGWALYMGVIFWIIAFIFVIPAITVLSDDSDPMFKRMVYGAYSGVNRLRG